MSMLAEPRRKQKWCLNPRGAIWSNDENKFGQKMLENMGWSKGKGLGKNEDGNVTHVAVTYKNDNKGMGFKGNDDNWIAHQDDFAALLNNLKTEHNPKSSEIEGEQVKSLEKKSKSSKKRVHYQKFTRGKDLSRYSSQDLCSILGKRSSLKHEKEDTDDSCNFSEATEVDNFKTSATSVSEYFAQKMTKSAKGSICVNEDEVDIEDFHFVGFSDDKKITEKNLDPVNQIVKYKVENNEENSVVESSNQEFYQDRKKSNKKSPIRKKKKCKKRH